MGLDTNTGRLTIGRNVTLTLSTERVEYLKWCEICKEGPVREDCQLTVCLQIPSRLTLDSDSIRLPTNQSRSQNDVTIDGQSASLSWCQAVILGPKPHLYHCLRKSGKREMRN
jgi:hypothetical protein